MQYAEYPDGRRELKFITAPTDEQLIDRLREEHKAALDAGATEIRQAVLEPDLPCPCGSRKKTKNCCLRRFRRIVANAGYAVPPLPVELEKEP